jgi:hypothetical protein
MTHPEALTLIEYIRKTGYKLNDIEKAFMRNTELHHKVSHKKAEWLLKIYAKSTGGGPFQKRSYI